MDEPLRPPEDTPARGVRAPGWDLLLTCVAVYVAVAVGRVHQLFPVLLPLKPALVATVLAIGLYLLQQVGQRRLGLLRSRATLCLGGIVLWAALSVPAALNAGVAFRAWTDILQTVIMSLVLAGSVRGARDVERLMFVYLGVTVAYVAVVLARFDVSADGWRLGHLYNYDANDMATLIVSAMPFGLYFVVARRRLLERTLAGCGLAVLAVGLIRSGSRGGFLAFLAVAAFVLLGFTTIRARSRLAGLVVILAVVLTTASDRYWTQMQTMLNPDQDYNTTSDAGRVKIWGRGLRYMADHPVFGVGASNFQVAEGTISPLAKLQERGIGVRWGAAHNSFIQVGAELGVPGLLFFLGWLAGVFGSLRRVTRQAARTSAAPIDAARLAQALVAALVGFLVGAFFLSLPYSDVLYTLGALALGLAKITRVHEVTRPPAVPRHPASWRSPGWRTA